MESTYLQHAVPGAQGLLTDYREALGAQAVLGEPLQGRGNRLLSGVSVRSRRDTIHVQDATQYEMERGHETTIEFNLPQHEQQPGTQVSR